MSARDEVLAAARVLVTQPIDGSFTWADVVAHLQAQGLATQRRSSARTSRGECVPTPPIHHAVTYEDLTSVATIATA